MTRLSFWNALLWGFSIALSWTWGLGLFFSVQMSIQFGLAGLLLFAIPNAIGLIAFGWFARVLANRFDTAEEFERYFLNMVGNFRWVFLLYQVVAIALTFFALFKYVFIPLNVNPVLIAFVVMGAGLLLGEQFNIRHIKWSHFAMALVIGLCIAVMGIGGAYYFNSVGVLPAPSVEGRDPILGWRFIGFFVPILAGFLLGPWLDIQQWQRAIQIVKEGSNPRTAYNLGGLVFFGILLFHGTLALSMWGEGQRLGLTTMVQPSFDGLFHAKDSVIRFLFLSGVQAPILFQAMYVTFLMLCIISTLDSGYVALKWFQTDAVKKSDSILVMIIPKHLLDSPVPPFALAAGIALLALPLHFELEYFMAFYGSFSIGYSIVFLFRTVFEPRFTTFTQTTLFSWAAFSVGVFGLGYFYDIAFLMVLGSLFPAIHAVAFIMTRRALEEIHRSGVVERISKGVRDSIAEHKIGPLVGSLKQGEGHKPGAEVSADSPIVVVPSPDLSQGVSMLPGAGSCWIEDKWFVHSLTATYQDTNSVGNVYFAQYAMWVGKTRELFFRHAMPSFDLRTTEYYILTRMFEHKFLQESREFEHIMVQVRVSEVNRKFVTMEHQILNSARKVLGKGKQVLMFVSSTDYRLIDIPLEVQKSFLPYLGSASIKGGITVDEASAS